MNVKSWNFLNVDEVGECENEKGCHFKVAFEMEDDLEWRKGEVRRIMEMREDDCIARPSFLKDRGLEHTVRARWDTPCIVRPLAEDGKRYIAYYHPQTFILAKNDEFKCFIIEHAIKRACDITHVPTSFNVSAPNNETFILPIRPRYELCLYSSSFCARQYFQLNVWLPKIISYQCILLEYNITNIIVQTEKPFKYDLTLKWPHQLVGHKVIFCSFIKKERRLTIVAEKLNFIEESEEEEPYIESCIENKAEISESATNLKVVTSESSDLKISEVSVEPEINCVDRHTHYKEFKEKKHLTVKFDSLGSCIVFQESEPVMDISERSKLNVSIKTKDGCSTKRYVYQMNKKTKSESNSQPNKSSKKNKCNGRKKK